MRIVDAPGVETCLSPLSTDDEISAAVLAPGDIGGLGQNGGPTRTHASVSGSPPTLLAEDGADPACGASVPPVEDQRGELRADGACDVGSYEITSESDSTSTAKRSRGRTR